jgi:hypothetical protein
MGKAMYKRKSRFDKMDVKEISEEILNLANKIQQQFSLRSAGGNNDSHSNTASQQQGIVFEPDPNNPFSSEPYYQNNNNNNRYQMVDDDLILSQDSFAPWNFMKTSEGSQQQQETTTSTNGHLSMANDPIVAEDIIVEKMHIHYGLKEENPVNRLRFFSKEMEEKASLEEWDENLVAYQIKETQYETLLPRVFEELAIRVFCRNSSKSQFVLAAFKEVSSKNNGGNLPFPMLSQSQL